MLPTNFARSLTAEGSALRHNGEDDSGLSHVDSNEGKSWTNGSRVWKKMKPTTSLAFANEWDNDQFMDVELNARVAANPVELTTKRPKKSSASVTAGGCVLSGHDLSLLG
ncbi:hypothetical protein PsorP6_019233 [Peronosclerospora sorghi]|nr:hypothetical protein PsorP6_019291 [Peronosclerospora sorghi]KAI9895307.1 hypothetical protein PsorP6_019233 [Peronosclerospora sorghi]